MSSKEPRFIKSPYFVNESGKWRIKPGTPTVLVKEFKEFMENDEAEDLEAVIQSDYIPTTCGNDKTDKIRLAVKDSDYVLLKDGRKGTIIFVYSDYAFLVEFMQSDGEWKLEDISLDQITEILYRPDYR